MTENPTRRRRTGRLPGSRSLPPWSLVAAGVVAGGLIGGGYGLLKAPAYTATSYVIAVPAERSDTSTALGFAQAYGRVATQPAVLAEAQRRAGVPVTTLAKSVRTATSPDAPMVAVSATSARPAQAAAMANAVAAALTRQADASKKATHVELFQFSRAVRPAEPSSASAGVTTLVGAGAGGLLGGLALLVRPRRREEPGTALPAPLPGPACAADVHSRL
ncbi:lipopolysaccharide biosynthesis protein [Streptomyces bauhiniae]|uniref:Lipopolysaccharide biosynthesis protein n=1 Tax=Streptomyces bauhiniae TaxID=2340725 RepID=A0A7K3R2X6_9ACTN|nr:lipopolysaccharide biosynthesis protein [Streptomyces bauhiniae]NEB96371.1 lipopolysaccharide biosynthesis protein [Streptomyces bauhiniae]